MRLMLTRPRRQFARGLVPESPANLCFGDMDRKTLFITARTSLYAIPVKVAGATRPE